VHDLPRYYRGARGAPQRHRVAEACIRAGSGMEGGRRGADLGRYKLHRAVDEARSKLGKLSSLHTGRGNRMDGGEPSRPRARHCIDSRQRDRRVSRGRRASRDVPFSGRVESSGGGEGGGGREEEAGRRADANYVRRRPCVLTIEHNV